MSKLSFPKSFVAISAFLSLSKVSCVSPTDEASALLDEARCAMMSSQYDKARELIDSLRTSYPKEFDVRRAAILVSDSIELAEAKDSLQIADSLEVFRAFQLEDTKKQFVLEKQEKYQSVGYYVVPAHAGNKSKLTFFPEVDENGKMLMVDIDTNRKYSFTEVEVEEDPATTLTKINDKYCTLAEEERVSVKQCCQLATHFLLYKKAKELKEKMQLKVRFYEKKIIEDLNP